MENEMLRYTVEYAYIWLQRVLGVGSTRVFEVLEPFSLNKDICSLAYASLKELGLFNKTELLRASKIKADSIYKTIEYCDENSIRIITPESQEYPESFRFIEAPPVVIFARGEKLKQDFPHIAIVGARKATEFGGKAAYSLAARLATVGFTVVSGGAVGIDSMAHIGAMKAGGKTVAVLGCGHDSNYLKSKEPMRKEIENNGTVITEFEPKTAAAKHTFPIRNRIISALSSGVAVVEAGVKSGALITATYAMEQGKEIFALPGNINYPQYMGTNQLIRDGAIPLITAEDIISVYIGRFGDKLGTDTELTDAVKRGYYELRQKSKPKVKENAPAKEKSKELEKIITPEFNGSDDARLVLSAFSNETEVSDILSSKSGVSGGRFISAITELELSGAITAVPVGRYKINFR